MSRIRKRNIVRECRVCGDTFMTAHRQSPSAPNAGAYCSPRCASSARRVDPRPARLKPAKRTMAERFWRKVKKADGDQCWEWTAAFFRAGYGKFAIEHRKIEGAHRVAWILAHGPIPNGLWVLHKCDVRRCCNPSHLFLGTVSDNVQDMLRKGRGGKNSIAADVVARISHLDSERMPFRRIGRAVSLSGVTVRRIALRNRSDTSTT